MIMMGKGQVWDMRTGTCDVTLEGHQGEVLCLKVADPGRSKIVSGGGSTDKTIKGTFTNIYMHVCMLC